MAQSRPVVPYAPAPPLGMADLPYDDGEPMESEKHAKQMALLVESLTLHFADRPDVYVGGNMAVYYSSLQAKNQDFRAPDVFVVVGAEPRAEPRLSWVVWEEERAPDLVIELLSPTTEENDRGRKKTIYAKAMRVQEYFLFDPNSLTFEGYSLEGERNEYKAMRRSGVGFGSAVLGLRLVVARGRYRGLDSDWLRWALPDGTVLPSGAEWGAEQQAKADAAVAKAGAADARAAKLAAQLRAAGIVPAE